MQFERKEDGEIVIIRISGKVDLKQGIDYWRREVASFGLRPVLYEMGECELGEVSLEDWRALLPPPHG